METRKVKVSYKSDRYGVCVMLRRRRGGGWGGGGGFFFFKQKTAYEIVSRDWSSDVCSSDLTVQQAYWQYINSSSNSSSLISD